MRLVYGVFEGREPAEQAVERLRQQRTAADLEAFASPVIHESTIREVDLPRMASFAVLPALVGGLVVATCVALLIGLLMFGAFEKIGGPSTVLGSDPVDLALLVLVLGGLAAAVAGIAGSLGGRAQVHKLSDELAMGRVVLTLGAPASRAKASSQILSSSGAIHVGVV